MSRQKKVNVHSWLVIGPQLDALKAHADNLANALAAAMAFIDSHAADPDLTADMVKTYAALREANPRACLLAYRSGTPLTERVPQSRAEACEALAIRVARLSPANVRIGAGMLASLVADAKRIVGDG